MDEKIIDLIKILNIAQNYDESIITDALSWFPEDEKRPLEDLLHQLVINVKGETDNMGISEIFHI